MKEMCIRDRAAVGTGRIFQLHSKRRTDHRIKSPVHGVDYAYGLDIFAGADASSTEDTFIWVADDGNADIQRQAFPVAFEANVFHLSLIHI